MEVKKTYPRIQSKVVKVWKEKYLHNGIDIRYNRHGVATWEMRSSNARFVIYQCAIPIKDITELDLNVELFKVEYPKILKKEVEMLLKAYPDDRGIKEDYRMFQRMFGGSLK